MWYRLNMSGWSLGARFLCNRRALVPTGIRHVVLSAFGCGAFENDPSEIAWVYKQAVERHRASFTVIAFAIFYAGHGEDNYKYSRRS